MDFRKIDKDQARCMAMTGVPVYVQTKGMREPVQPRTVESLREHPEDLDKYDPKIWDFFVEDWPMAAYNDFPSWAQWNVSLWLNNDEGLYRSMRYYKKRYGAAVGARKLLEELPQRTPDGARYTLTAIRGAMRD